MPIGMTNFITTGFNLWCDKQNHSRRKVPLGTTHILTSEKPRPKNPDITLGNYYQQTLTLPSKSNKGISA